jgi:hypothetical protein
VVRVFTVDMEPDYSNYHYNVCYLSLWHSPSPPPPHSSPVLGQLRPVMDIMKPNHSTTSEVFLNLFFHVIVF